MLEFKMSGAYLYTPSNVLYRYMQSFDKIQASKPSKKQL